MANIFEYDSETREIIETAGVASVVVGYADSQEDADAQIAEFLAREVK
jgi:hypothetical protein